MAVAPLYANGIVSGAPGSGRLAAPAFGRTHFSTTDRPGLGFGRGGRAAATPSHTVSAQYVAAEKLSLSYSNGDGDTVEIHYESIRSLSVASMGQMSDEERTALVDRLKEEFVALKAALLDSFIKGKNGKGSDSDSVGELESGEIEGLPEEWNAENTSERIVNFATSFYGMTESGGREFYELAKAAIEEGFRLARDIMGDLPGQVDELVNETYRLAMEKLDAWAVEKGIDLQEPAQAQPESIAA